jgi:hypothetical protein
MPPSPPVAGAPARFARPRRARAARRAPAAAAAPRVEAPAAPPSWRALALAGLAVLLFYGAIRLLAPQPWSYDEYYHLGVARELRAHFPLRGFPWTPFSILADHYADKELLFHLVLMPLAGLPLAAAGSLGAILGQLFVIAAFAWTLRRLCVPHAPWLVLGLAALGSMFAYRLDMCRPHTWMVGFTLLFFGLLAGGADRRSGGPAQATGSDAGARTQEPSRAERTSDRAVPAWVVFVAAALFGLTHTAGWVAIPVAAAWALAGLATPRLEGDRRILWRAIALAAGGWLAGQLVHPNFPENFRLVYLVNVIVPLQATGAGGAGSAASGALAAMIGEELTPPGLSLLAEQWPAFLAPALAFWLLLSERRLRTRASLAAAALALAFLLAGTLLFRRLLEVGAPLGLLALALALREQRQRGLRPFLPGWGAFAAALALLIGGLWTWTTVRARGTGEVSPPLAMARFLGEHGRQGERVFTVQWADSAPLFYCAPQLQSLVALDPTFFYLRDPALFTTYVDVAFGRDPDPVGTIMRRFGARYVTYWRAPAFAGLGARLERDPRAKRLYLDLDYAVLELQPGAAAAAVK